MLSLDAKQAAVRWPSRQRDTYRAILENSELGADEGWISRRCHTANIM